MSKFQTDLQALRNNISKAVLGKEEAVEHLLITLIAKGHMLIEDVPGVGKTTMATALAQSIDGSNHRIQFTSDLLPSDVIGVPVFKQDQNDFEFKEGPVFANIILADEINRTTPKTQSCLLEAMQDGRVSVEKKTYELPHPFMVIATQNPIEFHGTYPLPESQLDRFMMRIQMGYPSKEYELQILANKQLRVSKVDLKPVCTTQRILEIQEAVLDVKVDEALSNYILEIAERTRTSNHLELGVSPRGVLSLYRAAQAKALLQGRDYVVPDDIKSLVLPCFSHRITPKATFHPASGGGNGKAGEILVNQVLSQIEVPQ